MKCFNYIFFIFLSWFSLQGFALPDNGWISVAHNDDKAARTAFTEALRKDSLDQNALKGILYLSDIEQDKLTYQKIANTLIRNFPEEHFFAVFKNTYDGSPDFVIRQNGFSEEAKLPYILAQAARIREKRQFAESDKVCSEVLGNYHWSLIGPFKNSSGSGHDIEYEVEKVPFDSTSVYENSKGVPLKWITPGYVDGSDKTEFARYLPGNYNSATYYASAFIHLTDSRKIEIRVGSTTPVKVWVDQLLVLDNRLNNRFQWDNDILSIDLDAGVHRILVKCSTPPAPAKPYDFLSFFDSPVISDLTVNGWINEYLGISGETGSNETGFGIRLTRPGGKLIPGDTLQAATASQVNGYYAKSVSASAFNISRKDNSAIGYFRNAIDKNPDDLFNYYALCKAYFIAGLTRQAEPFFVKELRKNKDLVLMKYLTGKIYAQNGKTEKVFEVLNEINQEKTPVFGLLYSKFKEIDPGTEEQKYLASLDRLKTITPSNYSVISAYLKYYDKKGMRKQKENFISEMKKSYPYYRESLDMELEEDKPDKGLTDKERNVGTRYAISKIRSRFLPSDYSTAILYYKNSGRVKKVIGLYTDLIRNVPYNIEYRQEMAQYLKEQNRFSLAAGELFEALSVAPYNSQTLEYLGDIYSDKNKNNVLASDSLALCYYKLSKKYQPRNSGLEAKIAKIEGQKKLNGLFATKTFEDILNDGRWKNKYAGEESVVLLYTRNLIYDSNAHVEVYQQMMVKILTESGAKHWTEYDFSFMGNVNKLRVIKSNGAEVTPDKQGGYVVIKNLEPGDILQIDGVQEWEQQTELDKELAFIHYASFETPIYYHKFEVAVPRGRYLGYLYHKLDSNMVKSTHDGFDFYKWEYYGIPKIETEETAVDLFDLYSTIMISTMPDWGKLSDWYQQTTYGKFDLTYEVKEALDSIIRPEMDDAKKVEAIYNYLTREIKYSYVPFLQSGYIPKDPGLTLSSRIGDCKDVATLMIVMLRATGIEANYALVKSNSFNHQDMLPSLYFDHVIVQYVLEGKTRFLDMTTDFYPWYVLTENDVNAYALIVKKGSTSIFHLPDDDLDPEKNKIELDITAKLHADKSVDLSVQGTYPGIAGGSMREYFSSISEQEQKNYLSQQLGKAVFSDMQLLDHRFDNINEISKPLKAELHFKAYDFSDQVANLLVFRIPYLYAVQSNPAISGKQRHNRIDVGKLGNTSPSIQRIRLEIPDHYRLLKLPPDINYQDKFGNYKVTFRKTGDGLLIEKEQAFTKRIIPVSEFNEFRAFYLKLLSFDKTKLAIQQL